MISARNVVLATPVEVARELLGLPAIKRGVPVQMFEVKGRLRRSLGSGDLHLFREGDPFHAIVRHPSDLYLVCSRLERPAFDGVFNDWEVIEHRHWNPAFNIDGTELLKCEQGPNLFVVGDHNVCGLEDAYLTGHYAAGQIVDRALHRERIAPTPV